MDQLALPIATHATRTEGSALLLLAHGAAGERTAGTSAILSFAPIEGGAEAQGDESSRATSLAVDALAHDTRQSAAAVERDMAASRRFDGIRPRLRSDRSRRGLKKRGRTPFPADATAKSGARNGVGPHFL
jgi:hypothetical protein